MLFQKSCDIRKTSRRLGLRYFDSDEEVLRASEEAYRREVVDGGPLPDYRLLYAKWHDAAVLDWRPRAGGLSFVLRNEEGEGLRLDFSGLRYYAVFKIGKHGRGTRIPERVRPEVFLYEELSVGPGGVLEFAMICTEARGRKRRRGQGSPLWIIRSDGLALSAV